MARITMKRVYAIFENGEVIATGATKAEGEALVRAFEKKRRVEAHEAEDTVCPDGSGRCAPGGQHWVRSLMSGEWVLEANGTPYTCSVQSETYWSS